MRGLRARQIAIGITAGLLAGLGNAGLLAALNGSTAIARLGGASRSVSGLVIHLILSALMGIAYAWLFRPAPGHYAETLMSGVAYGLLGWVLLSLNLIPVLTGQGPQWQTEAVASALPALVGYLFQGAIISLGYHRLSGEAVRRLGPVGEPVDVADRPAAPQHRIVILGGGYAGVTTAQHLERLFARDAVIKGKKPKPFSHRSIGSLAVLGHQTAVAEIRCLKFSGLLAWLMWRAVYLVKLPTLEKKVRWSDC